LPAVIILIRILMNPFEACFMSVIDLRSDTV